LYALNFHHSLLIAVYHLTFGMHLSGISDVAEAYQAAIKAVTTESQSVVPHASVQEKANAFSENLRADQTTAVCKIQEGMQFLAHVLISTSMNAA